MKRHRLVTACAFKRRGENVLPRVLLHVVKAALPVDVALDSFFERLHARMWATSSPSSTTSSTGNPAERAAVTGLPARLRVECRPVKVDPHAARVGAGAHDARAEFL